jgi:hypothetical protein
VCVYVAHWPFCSSSRLISRVHHLCSPFLLQLFFSPNDLFSVWFPFSVYTYVVLIFFLYCTPYELLFEIFYPQSCFLPKPFSLVYGARPYLLSAIYVTRYLFEFSVVFLHTISTQYRLRSFVRIIRLIRLFFMFFPSLLDQFDSPLILSSYILLCLEFHHFPLFLLAVCETSSLLPLHPIAANPTIDCLLHCYCQLNFLAIFSLLLSTVLHYPFSCPYPFGTS